MKYETSKQIIMVMFVINSYALPVNPCLICVMMELIYSANYALVLL